MLNVFSWILDKLRNWSILSKVISSKEQELYYLLGKNRIETKDKEIEAGILPVCEVLNSIKWVNTLRSCEWHINSNPFVIFSASHELALKIHNIIEHWHWKDQSLKFCWIIRWNFIGNDWNFQRKIEPFDRRLRGDRSKHRLKKEIMTKELERLAILLSHLCKNE